MAVILKGIDVANAMKGKMIEEVNGLKNKGVSPCLAIVRVGSRPDDLAYERGAIKRCEIVGVECKVFEYREDISQAEFLKEFSKVNDDSSIHGILLFRPLPKQIDEEEIKNVIAPEKDIDCMSPVNIAKVFAGDESGFAPCTPEAVIEMLDHNKISIEGKQVVIIGRSMVVGKPLSMLLIKRNATVTVCHTRTRDLEKVCSGAEILIAAAGKAKMVTAGFIPAGCTVIDVGINVDSSGNLCGDVEFEQAQAKAAYVTPVPGGVGSVTTSVLVNHVIRAAMLK
jgi:methylenetetrahydrofolate dehydrogenase (NADP+) / methenyltetrahydrofolate cyclohydrolase